MTKVAIIGCGISGICAARACIEHHLHFTVYDRRTLPGGIWSTQNTPVFDNLTTNTPCFDMFMSDLIPKRITKSSTGPHDDLCVSKQEMFDYLCSALNHTPHLADHVIFGATVTSVQRLPNSPQPRFQLCYEKDSVPSIQIFDHVMVATGVFDNPFIPTPQQLPGIDTYASPTMHVSDYQTPSQLQGKRVLVVGGSHSALEAVADMLSAPQGTGPSHVTVSTRVMRQIMVKQIAGRALCADYSTRYALLRTLADRMTPEQLLREMSLFNVDHRQIHAPAPNVPLIIPPFLGFTVVKGSLVDAAKGGHRLSWHVGGIKALTQHGVQFVDGTCDQFDTIVFATGYRTKVPCLSKDIQHVITPQDGSNVLELYDYTFHPDLPGMSFIGLFAPGTSCIPMHDNQARWVAATIAGEIPMVPPEEMRKGIDNSKQLRKQRKFIELTLGFRVLDLFAKHGGFDVDLGKYPQLTKALIFGPLSPSQYRMFGRGKLQSAKHEFEKQITAYWQEVGDNTVLAEKLEELKAVTEVLEKKGIAPTGLRQAVSVLRAS